MKITQVAVVFVLAALAALFMQSVTQPMGFGDSSIYRQMAQSPGTLIKPPWGFRIAVPYTAALISNTLNIDLRYAFAAMQIAMYALIMTGLWFWTSRALCTDRFSVALMCLLFMFSYPGVYNLHNVVHVGLAEHLLVLAGCIAIYHGRFSALMCVILVSCFVKESVGMLLIPTFIIVEIAVGKRSLILRRAGMLIAIYAGCFLLLRSGLLFANRLDTAHYAYFYSWKYMQQLYNYWGGVLGAVKHIAVTFGPTWILALGGFIVAPSRLKWLSCLVLFAASQIVLATDVMRMVGTAYPAVLALSVFCLVRVKRHWAALLVGSQALYFFCYNYGVGAGSVFVVFAPVSLLILLLARYYSYVPYLQKMMPLITRRSSLR